MVPTDDGKNGGLGEIQLQPSPLNQGFLCKLFYLAGLSQMKTAYWI